MSRPSSRVGWLVLLLIAVGAIAVGAVRDSGPRTPDERIASISERIACPVCDGESVAESRNPTSLALMERIRLDVREGRMSDDEIIDSITSARDGKELLVPTASGVDALAWALPAAAFVVALVGLVVAFRRWRRQAAQVRPVTDDDVKLVAEALAHHDAPIGSSPERASPDQAPSPDRSIEPERVDEPAEADR